MKAARIALIAVVCLVAWRAYVALQPEDAEDGALTDDGWLPTADSVLQGTAEAIDSWTGGMLKISAMAKVDKGLASNANVQAFLRVIRTGEGTAGPDGYRKLFGGGLFESLKDHPRILVKKSGYTSTAAGAYQALASTWDETARIMSLADFSPANQDLFAIGRLAARGALADVVAGNFAAAVTKAAKEWASLPGSPYGQPTITLATAKSVYVANGGKALA